MRCARLMPRASENCPEAAPRGRRFFPDGIAHHRCFFLRRRLRIPRRTGRERQPLHSWWSLQKSARNKNTRPREFSVEDEKGERASTGSIPCAAALPWREGNERNRRKVSGLEVPALPRWFRKELAGRDRRREREHRAEWRQAKGRAKRARRAPG